jgi:hypothetical protein
MHSVVTFQQPVDAKFESKRADSLSVAHTEHNKKKNGHFSGPSMLMSKLEQML